MMNRRQFLITNLGVTLGQATFSKGLFAFAQEKSIRRRGIPKTIPPGIKLGLRLPPRLSDSDLKYMRQLNLVSGRLDINYEDANEAFLRETYARYSTAGISLFASMCRFPRSPEIGLGLEGRDRKIALEQDYIRLLGQIGIPNFEISFTGFLPGSQIYSTGTGEMRGIQVRQFDLAEMKSNEKKPDRIYSAEEITENFDYYMERILPVAEEAGVRIAIHPDDPPIPWTGGVARIFHHIDHFDRAFNRHPSPNLGILLCIGTWAEGGDAMGATPTLAVRHFAAKRRLFSVHFRNVSASLPVFEETFMDNGYINMQEVMDALVDVDFDGLVVPDHIPHFDVDTERAVRTGEKTYQSPFRPAGVAYSAAVLNAYLNNSLRKKGIA